MRTDDVIRVFGSKVAIAELLDIERSAISQWGEVVPKLRQYELREKRPSIDKEIKALRQQSA